MRLWNPKCGKLCIHINRVYQLRNQLSPQVLLFAVLLVLWSDPSGLPVVAEDWPTDFCGWIYNPGSHHDLLRFVEDTYYTIFVVYSYKLLFFAHWVWYIYILHPPGHRTQHGSDGWIFFAGQAAATVAMKEQGLFTARLDYEYRSVDGSHAGTAMDICSDVGLGV